MNSLIQESFHKEKLDLLLRLIGQINSNLDINKVLLNIIDAAKIITDSEACSVFLTDKLTDEMILSIPTGPAGDSITGKRFPMGEGIAGWVAENGEPQIVNDVSADERFRGDFNPEIFITRNILCAPLLNQSQEVIGVLQAINKEDAGQYLQEEVPLFQALANQAAIAITNARMHEERTTLLAEIHHRVKNNMAVVSSLIQMQAMMETDEGVQGKLLVNVARISSMATVHEQLYQSDSFSRLNLGQSIEKVSLSSLSSLNSSSNVNAAFACDNADLSINQSIPCSLIVNEVIIHLVKHGFKTVEKGEFHLELTESTDKESILLTIQHNGQSIRERIEGEDISEAGFHLIEVLSKQLEAEYSYTEDPNRHEFSLWFQKSDKKGVGNGSL
ncbi:GAF domain-containing protein [Rhodohalobacter sp. SW132]|uniref:histidine kinase dimerization/phosphoacceptor domain -containing protein n=1 Tax=Rhodohalobacter sp. SW132 TaxID=2293433 RepID=UPI000E21F732|nr:histidine kinase dimerization/phosphoacceptor domain -containing protein [Rhodohalobacter sp. SW132]REL38969.1 GAF domain-containing protein [Rhodohalobacter sp. SW132]